VYKEDRGHKITTEEQTSYTVKKERHACTSNGRRDDVKTHKKAELSQR